MLVVYDSANWSNCNATGDIEWSITRPTQQRWVGYDPNTGTARWANLIGGIEGQWRFSEPLTGTAFSRFGDSEFTTFGILEAPYDNPYPVHPPG